MIVRTAQIVTMALLLALVTGCTHWYEDYTVEEELDPLEDWVGWRAKTLVMRWGAPDKVYEMKDGGRILTWRRSRTEKQRGELYTVTETQIVDGRKVLVPVTRLQPATTTRYHCITNIEIDTEDYVAGYNQDGNDCANYPPPPE